MTAQLRLDEQGRVLIPQELRDALGLQTGGVLDADVQGGQLILRPQQGGAVLIEHEGRLVIRTPAPVIGDPVNEFRQAQLQDLGNE